MIRTAAVWLFALVLSGYAWRDWYKALCGLILLMAVVQHPDFPNGALGIHGLNPWNLLLLNVTLAWLAARKREGLEWDLPKDLTWSLVIFFAIMIIAYIRMAGDLGVLREYAMMRNKAPPSQMWVFSEYIINCFKWIVPAILLFDGCRDEKRFRLAVYSIVGMLALLALQVVRWMPLSMLTEASRLSERALKILQNEIGFHRVNMSMMMAGAAWAFYAVRDLPKHPAGRMGFIFLSGFALLALALTGGRMGLVTWIAMAGIFAWWRWRRLLVIGPLLLIIVIAVVPAARDRLLQGFGGGEISTNRAIESTLYVDENQPHWYTVTSGRTIAWPLVVAKIGERPLIGHGRKAMQRTEVAQRLLIEYGESFPHPHNAYLQWAMDNGILGLIPVLFMFFLIVRSAKTLFLDDNDVIYVIAGGLCLSLTLAFLIASIGSQTFYPREGAVAMWCSIGLMWRVSLERARLRVPATATVDKKPRGPVAVPTPTYSRSG